MRLYVPIAPELTQRALAESLTVAHKPGNILVDRCTYVEREKKTKYYVESVLVMISYECYELVTRC